MPSDLLYTTVGHFFQTPSITRSSAQQYQSMLVRWLRYTGCKEIDTIIADPKKYIQFAHEKYTSGDMSHASKKLLIATVCAVYKHHPEYETKFKEQRAAWSAALKESNQKEFDVVAHLEPSEKQLLNWVNWSCVLKKEQQLRATEYASDDHLLLSMYTLIEPARGDYGELHIVVDDSHARKLNKKGENYMFLTSEPGKSYLVLNQYKTVKSFGRFWRYLPDDLVRIIATNLERSPREYLFVNRRFRKPYDRRAFIHMVNQTYRRIFGKNMTVSMMRHSFISSLDFNTTTPARLFEISKNMQHSVQMQQLYRRNVNVPEISVTLQDDQPRTVPPPPCSEEHDAEREARRLRRRERKRQHKMERRQKRKEQQKRARALQLATASGVSPSVSPSVSSDRIVII